MAELLNTTAVRRQDKEDTGYTLQDTRNSYSDNRLNSTDPEDMDTVQEYKEYRHPDSDKYYHDSADHIHQEVGPAE